MAKVEIRKNYHLMLELLINLYKNNNYEIERDIHDEKGMPFACDICIERITQPHPYFCIQHKETNSITEIRTHKKCMEDLDN